MKKSNSAAQDIEQLRERHQQLTVKRGVAESQLAAAEKRLADLRTEARAQYGTDDLEQLRAQLAAMRAENERKRSEYQQHLDSIEERLRSIEDGGAEDVEL